MENSDTRILLTLPVVQGRSKDARGRITRTINIYVRMIDPFSAILEMSPIYHQKFIFCNREF